MLTKAEVKKLSSLSQKKYRLEYNLFITEGIKSVTDGLDSDYQCEILLVTNEFQNDNPKIIAGIKKNIRIEVVKNSEMQKICDTVNPQGIAAAFQIRDTDKSNFKNSKVIVVLENISDPGNLGTIIRSCDWFGIWSVLANQNCADLYNPKVIRSTMGSVFHINYMYTEVLYNELLQLKSTGFNILTADMKGKNVFEKKFDEKTIICFCNEANGPTEELKMITDEFIHIPAKGKAESLNVASAAAVIISRVSKVI